MRLHRARTALRLRVLVTSTRFVLILASSHLKLLRQPATKFFFTHDSIVFKTLLPPRSRTSYTDFGHDLMLLSHFINDEDYQPWAFSKESYSRYKGLAKFIASRMEKPEGGESVHAVPIWERGNKLSQAHSSAATGH